MYPVPTSENSLFDIFSLHEGYLSDKWEQYLGIYESELRAIIEVDRPLRLLEIGVQNGGSLQIWSKYLPIGSSIVGIDIDEKCGALKFSDSTEILIGDATDKSFLDTALGDVSFDIVIDDGSHKSADIIASFNALLPRLNSGGKYFIEDLHASYWRSHGGGFRTPDSAIEFLKSLIDPLHLDHVEKDVSFDLPDEATRYAIHQQVARISFYDSVAVIEKYRQLKERPFERVLSGKRFEVSGPAWLNALIISEPKDLVFCGDSARDIVAVLASDVGRVQNELDRRTAELTRQAEQRTTEYQAAVHGLQTELDQRTTEYQAVVQGHQTELAQRSAEHQAVVQGHQTELAQRSAEHQAVVQGHQTELAQRSAEHQAVVQGHQTELAQRTAEHQVVVERLQTQLAQRTAEFQNISSSVSWRATSPIRNFLGRSPWVTRQARRVLEVLSMTSRQSHGLSQLGHANRQNLKPELLSPGEASSLVRSFYKAAFGREADSDALATWVRELRSGISLEALAEHFVRSAEFEVRHGSSSEVDIKYITALYREGLGRLPDSEGLVSWLAEVEKGTTRAKVLAGIAGSKEARERVLSSKPESLPDSLVVHAFYRTAFGRAPDENGLAGWVRELGSGKSVEALAEHFVRSAEFEVRHGSNREVDIKYITALYRDGLGRSPDSEGLAFWLAEVEKRATRAKVLAGIAGSKEARERVLSPKPESLPDSQFDEATRSRLMENLREELAIFLKTGQRLSFSAQEAPDISVIIVLFNQAHFTLRCLRTVMAQTSVRLEVVLVDNCSTDDTPKLLTRLDNVRVIRNNKNLGFLLGVNRGVEEARGRTILLLNNDAFMRENALATALVTLESDDKIGAVGGKIIRPSGRLQEAGSIVWRDGSTMGYARNLDSNAGEAMFRRDVDYCSGCFLLTYRILFERLGKFNSIYAPIYYEETEYCFRLWEDGLRVVYEPRAVIDHYETGTVPSSTAISLSKRNRKVFRRQYSTTLQSHLPPSERNLLFARNHGCVSGRLLVIDNEVPLVELGSGYPRMRTILNEAVSTGWFVTLYPLQNSIVNWEAAYSELSAEIEICSGRGEVGLAEFLSERQGYYDVMLVSRPDNMSLFRKAVSQHPHVTDGVRIIYDAEALFAARAVLRSKINGSPMTEEAENAMIGQEVALAAGVDAIVTVNQREAEIFRQSHTCYVGVLGRGIQVARNAPGFECREGFLFVGRLLEKDMPNYQGLSWFIREIWPKIRATLTDATLTVIGALHCEPTELMGPGIQLLGPIKHLEPFYDRAGAFIAPIQFAAGVPNKVLEATAAGVPVVGTHLLAQQLDWEAGLEMEAADEPEQMARAAIALHENQKRWEEVRTAGQRRLSHEHSQEVFRQELRALLDGSRQVACGHQSDTLTDAHRIARVNAVWAGGELPREQGQLWMAHPTLRACLNRKASGKPEHDAYVRLKHLLTDMGWVLPVERAVSLCCGAGELERGLAALGIARMFSGYDLSESAISKAQALANAEGFNNFQYEVRDLECQGIVESNVPLIFAHSALHHIARLEGLLDSVLTALRPGGIFHVNEYVGPDRFQWTDRQLAEMNDFLQTLSERYRRLPDGGLRSRVDRPTIDHMLKFDPSEAVRSSEIEKLVTERFKIIERRPLGGALLHIAISGIAQNFDPAQEEDRVHLKRLIDLEDRLTADGVLASDFLVIIAQREH
jgi:GT2 family glycosyltransferase/SAM-dependent methyltransferase